MIPPGTEAIYGHWLYEESKSTRPRAGKWREFVKPNKPCCKKKIVAGVKGLSATIEMVATVAASGEQWGVGFRGAPIWSLVDGCSAADGCSAPEGRPALATQAQLANPDQVDYRRRSLTVAALLFLENRGA